MVVGEVADFADRILFSLCSASRSVSFCKILLQLCLITLTQ